MKETHSVLDGSERVALAGAKVLGRANPNTMMQVTLKLRRKEELPELEGRPSATLTREELASQYGAKQADIEKVGEVLSKFGLEVIDSDPATRTVRVSGPVSAMENAFAVTLLNYAHESGNYRGRVGPIQVPVELKDIVEGVFGLDNRRVARRRRQPVHEAAHAKSMHHIPATWYIPSELAKHYNFPAGDGSGQTVAILEFGGGYFPADLATFCSLAKVTVPTVQTVSVDGTSTSAKDGAEGEVMLDVEVVAGVCPKSTIVLYFAHWGEQGWIRNLDAVMQDSKNNPGVVSISWGYAEDADIWTKAAMKQVNESLKEAALMGITVCVAAGDDGSSDAVMDGHAHADFPSSSPYVLAIGGTTIPKKGGTQPDICWKEGDGLRSDNGGSTGGGVSRVFKRPSWQSAIKIKSVNHGAIVGRVLPDIAANADWDASPYLLVVDGGAQGNGGTSAATPLWASLITLINAQRGAGNRLGYVTPVLYQAAGTSTVGGEGCNDITTGDNNTAKVGGYSAGAGYDAVSGWGTPDGVKLAGALGKAAPAGKGAKAVGSSGADAKAAAS